MSTLQRLAQPRITKKTITVTAAKTLTIRDHDARIIIDATSTTTVTLPEPKKGVEFIFYVKTAATSGNGHTIATKGSTEKVFAKGFAAAAGKGAVNTQATGAQGDSFRVFSDGTDWFGVATSGTWARQA